MFSLRLTSLVIGAGVVVGGAITLKLRRRGRSKVDDKERQRRMRLSVGGRLTTGTVIDVQEMTNGEGKIPTQLLIYTYDVAGVQYECSQDVTHLRPFIDLHSCRLGLPTSIKYDPHNPGNSVVISEEWSGLRK